MAGVRGRARGPACGRSRRWRRTAAPPSDRRRCPGPAVRAGYWSTLCQPSTSSVIPSTSPCGHQLRRKNSRMARATATTMPWSTPSRMTPALATSEISTALRRTLQTLASTLKSISDSAATMTTAASAVCGRSASSELRNRSRTATSAAPTRPASWLRAPDCSATAVREPLVEIAKPWKKPAATLAAPMPTISWSASTSSPRRAAKLADGGDRVGQRDERDAERGDEQRHDVAGLRPREARGRDPLRQRADRGDALRREVERGRERRHADDGDQYGGHALGQSGQDQQHEEHADADDQGRGVGLVQTLEELLDLVEEAAGVGREPEELRKLPDDDRDRQAVHVPDLHLLGEQVRDEAELPDPEPDLDEPDEDREHPGERDRRSGIPAGDEQRRDRGEDQRRDRRVGSEHQNARGPEQRVADEAGDRRVEAGDRRQPGELGVRHALRDQDRREHDSGYEVRAQPRPVVAARGAYARDPPLHPSVCGHQ